MQLQYKNKISLNSISKFSFWRTICFLLPLCLTVGSVYAQLPQEKFILTQDESGTTKNYVARDYIELNEGFVYTPTSTTTFLGEIDEGLLFPPTEDTYVFSDGSTSTNPSEIIGGKTETGAVVGAIAGSAAVSPTGGASYQIPIEIPAGINGMQPNVALVYNSQGGNGIAGWGWNISGVSMISRVPKTYYYDDERTGIIWDKTSPLVLDGQRLIEVNRWGTDSVEYRTESESYNRIVGCDIKDWGPLYFKVYTKTGQLIQYGNLNNIASYYPYNKTPTSEVRFLNFGWAISKIVDNNRNTINFYYINEAEETGRGPVYSDNRLDKITYGGNLTKGKEDDLTIKFEYDNIASDKIIQTYIDGKETTRSKITGKIKVLSGSLLLRTYTLSYNVVESKYHLLEVGLTNDTGEKLKPLVFNWKDHNYKYKFETSVTFNYNSSPLIYDYKNNQGYDDGFLLLGKSFGDLDGDGDLDVLIKYRLEKEYYKNNWDKFWDVKSHAYKYIAVVYLNQSGSFTYIYNEEFDDDYNYYYVFLDKDNDGNDELLRGKPYVVYGGDEGGRRGGGGGRRIIDAQMDVNTATVGGGRRYEFICYKYQNNTLERKSSYDFLMPLEDYDTDDITMLPGDFLGNGETQFMGFTKDENGLYKLVDFSEEDVNVTDIDVNVNSKVESYEWSDLYISDFNGNGKTELVYVNDDLRIYELYTTSVYSRSGYVSVQKLGLKCTYPGIVHNDDIYTGDFNGDGNTDFLVHKYTDNTWKFLISTGSGLVEQAMNNTLPGSLIGIKIIDANRDGRSDILFSVIENFHIKFKLLVNNGVSFEEKFSEQYTGSTFGGIEMTGRFNGDKYEDIFLSYASKSDLITISKDETFDKIIDFKDSYDNSTSVTYNLFSTNKLKSFTSGIDGDNVDDRNVSSTDFGTWDVVSQVTKTDANNTLSQTNKYDFNTACIHKQGKGFLGYLSASVQDITNYISTTTTNKLNEQFYVLHPSTTTTIVKYPDSMPYGPPLGSSEISDVGLPGGTMISKETFNSTIEDLGSNRYNLKFNSQFSEDGLKNLNKTVEYYNYDNYGNPETIKTTQGGIVQTKSIVYDSKGSWCPNKPLSISSTTTYDNDTYSRTTTYEYNGKGNLIKEIKDFDNVVTEYKEFDDFGNAWKVETTANGKIRTSSVTYTPSGRFVDSKTNIFGETTTYHWNENKGVLDSEDDNWGYTTSYVYDSWGRLKETIYPSKVRTTEVYQWAKVDNEIGAKYYSYSQSSGSAPIIVWYDALGRELVKETYGLNNNKIAVFTKYRLTGKVDKVSEPTFKTSIDEITNDEWAATYYYDTPGRTVAVVTPSGATEIFYNQLTTTTTSFNGTKATILNLSGLIDKSIVNDKSVSYTYYASGLTKTATPEGDGQQPIQMFYNLQGNRTKLIDPDAGLVRTEYNGFGELTKEVQKIHTDKDSIVTINNYEPATGLLSSIVRNTETTTYKYDSDLQHKSRIKSIEITGKHKQSFTYDNLSRLTNVKEEIDGKTFNRGSEYDALGRVKKEIYPTGYYTLNIYDTNGNLTQVKDKNNRSIWTAVEENARGQLTEATKGGRAITYGFDERGLPTNIQSLPQTGAIVNMEYSFNAKGNLDYRIDNISNQQEDFEYDDLNRLTDWTVTRNGIETPYGLAYNNVGNIETKQDLGADNIMTYGINGKPHALTGISGVPVKFPTADLTVTYTDFKKIATLNEGVKDYELTYGVDDQRRKSVYYANGKSQGATLTRYYIGDYEEEINSAGNVRKIHYLSGAIYIDNSNYNDSLYYVYTDYQGSVIALTDESGNVKRRYAYDPWGQRRNPENWTETDNLSHLIIDRGYTGHEHLDQFGIINMNGRVYDPLTASFFSPDPYVQAPSDWLNYNRYSYCLGNPFKYTDPSGEFLVWSIGNGGFSIGLNFTPIGIPLGFGINVGWGDGLAPGVYGEVGLRVGGTGFGSGVTVQQSLDYNFKNSSWSTTTSEGAYASFGPFNAGVNFSQSYNMTSSQWSNGWGVSAGIGLGNDARGIGFNVGYGSSGFTIGMGGYYNSHAWDSNPVHEPEKWNDNGEIQKTNNCYSYALDERENGNYWGLQPGDEGGQPLTSSSDVTLEYVTNAAISDGRIKEPNFLNKLGFGKKGYYSAYLVIDEGVDYHWYRQDKGGYWSHKPGITSVVNVDASGYLITNPANANHHYPGVNYNNGGILLWIKGR